MNRDEIPDWLPQERRQTPIAEDSLALMALQICTVAQRVEVLASQVEQLAVLLPEITAMAKLLRWWRTTAEVLLWIVGIVGSLWAILKFLLPSIREGLK